METTQKPTIFFQTIWSRQFLQLQDPVSPTQDSKVIEIYWIPWILWWLPLQHPLKLNYRCMSCMENAKKPAVFLPISLKPLSKYLVAQNGAFERQIAAILTHRRHFICRTLNLNSLSFLASLVTSTGSTNLACPTWNILQNLRSSIKPKLLGHSKWCMWTASGSNS